MLVQLPDVSGRRRRPVLLGALAGTGREHAKIDGGVKPASLGGVLVAEVGLGRAAEEPVAGGPGRRGGSAVAEVLIGIEDDLDALAAVVVDRQDGLGRAEGAAGEHAVGDREGVPALGPARAVEAVPAREPVGEQGDGLPDAGGAAAAAVGGRREQVELGEGGPEAAGVGARLEDVLEGRRGAPAQEGLGLVGLDEDALRLVEAEPALAPDGLGVQLRVPVEAVRVVAGGAQPGELPAGGDGQLGDREGEGAARPRPQPQQRRAGVIEAEGVLRPQGAERQEPPARRVEAAVGHDGVRPGILRVVLGLGLDLEQAAVAVELPAASAHEVVREVPGQQLQEGEPLGEGRQLVAQAQSPEAALPVARAEHHAAGGFAR